jgi:hypothetical protein
MADTLRNPPMEGISEAPEIYVDGYQGALLLHGVVKLNLFSEFGDGVTPDVRRRGVARMTVSLANLAAIHTSLGELLKSLAEQGALQGMETPPTRQ